MVSKMGSVALLGTAPETAERALTNSLLEALNFIMNHCLADDLFWSVKYIK
jgi:hypothetical protein